MQPDQLMPLIKDLRPQSLQDEYTQAVYSDTVAKLAHPSAKTVIAHIDSGIASHPSLGYAKDAADTDPPENILLDKGVNFFDPRPDQDPPSHLPVSPLKRSGRFLDKLIEHPDHGVKTLSAILGATDDVITVGGYDYKDGKNNSGSLDHYPEFKYRLQGRVDVSALAKRMNRASFNLDADPPVPEYAEQSKEKEPSGTSYAAAQVSAVAALWVEKYHAELETLFANNRYKIVEAFRAALKTTNYGTTTVKAALPIVDPVDIRPLDIVKVLAKPPVDSPVLPVQRAVVERKLFSSA